jgi:GMP synthase (glutamine-hydrolysing)
VIESVSFKGPSATIKSHHNVGGLPEVMRLALVEPLRELFKDEVRQLGRELGLPAESVQRQPFPGPGLAIRCLCSKEKAPVVLSTEGILLPVRSVGVQGDLRSYRQALALERPPDRDAIENIAPALTNERSDINRVVALCGSKAPVGSFSTFAASITRERLDVLREADAIVREFCLETGFENEVWQFPVVLVPLGVGSAAESVVLRPISSVDGMTADVVLMPEAQLQVLTDRLLDLPDIAAVFYDLTHKPPGTIEWE